MSSEHLKKNSEENVVIIIDIEKLFLANENHPQHDPGTIILYRIKVDEKYHDVKHPHITGNGILALEGKSPEHFQVLQVFKEHGNPVLKVIEPTEVVDLSKVGIERFIIEKKRYPFFIGPKEYQSEQAHLTVREILVNYAKVSPEEKLLAIKDGEGFHSYENLDEKIHLVPVKHFKLFDKTPTGKS
jgi:hypothetical protein